MPITVIEFCVLTHAQLSHSASGCSVMQSRIVANTKRLRRARDQCPRDGNEHCGLLNPLAPASAAHTQIPGQHRG